MTAWTGEDCEVFGVIRTCGLETCLVRLTGSSCLRPTGMRFMLDPCAVILSRKFVGPKRNIGLVESSTSPC